MTDLFKDTFISLLGMQGTVLKSISVSISEDSCQASSALRTSSPNLLPGWRRTEMRETIRLTGHRDLAYLLMAALG